MGSEAPPEAALAEPRSFATATQALEDLFAAVPKSKRSLYLGELNEISVWMSTVLGFFQAVLPEDDVEGRTRVRLLSVPNMLSEYLDRITPDEEN